ncbi:dipeptidase [bacterium BMS3Abin03]|nr:dipeptidase [bacterium BMS3Abin03]
MKVKKIIIAFITIFLLHNFTCFTSGCAEKKEDKQVKNDSAEQKLNNSKMDSTINKFTDLEKDAFKLHYDAIVIDTHNDILMPVMLNGADITRETKSTQSDLVKWKKGGLDVQIFSIYIPEKIKSDDFNYAIKLIDYLDKLQSEYPDELYMAKNYKELIKRINDGKFCGLMGAEGGNIIEGSMDNLETIYSRGVKYLGLTWNTSNAIGVSAKDETQRGKKGGLTEFGIEVVKKMNELGMMIDVSHLGETAFWDVVNTSKDPIIASHSCVYTLSPLYRNLKDDQIKAIAESGGIICVNFYSRFLDPNANTRQINAIHKKYKSALKPLEEKYGDDLIGFNEERYQYLTENYTDRGVPIDVLIDHIDYIVKLVGIDYVGLGSDFDGGISTPNELYDATCYPVITKKLVERGYSEQDIRKILGLNFLRVFKRVCG